MLVNAFLLFRTKEKYVRTYFSRSEARLCPHVMYFCKMAEMHIDILRSATGVNCGPDLKILKTPI